LQGYFTACLAFDEKDNNFSVFPFVERYPDISRETGSSPVSLLIAMCCHAAYRRPPSR
jgi:hypothetical protein